MLKFDERKLVDLVRNKISVDQLEIGLLKIGSRYDLIDIFEITDIYIQDVNINSDNSENDNLTIKERLAKLEKLNGWIHLAGGLSCRIQNQLIANLRLTKKYIEPISNFKRDDIIKFHGNPDYELVDDYAHGGFDYAIDNYILVYNNKKLNFYLDPIQENLTEIDTAKLDMKYFTLR